MLNYVKVIHDLSVIFCMNKHLILFPRKEFKVVLLLINQNMKQQQRLVDDVHSDILTSLPKEKNEAGNNDRIFEQLITETKGFSSVFKP